MYSIDTEKEEKATLGVMSHGTHFGAILRTRTPAMQVQTPPLEGPRILREAANAWENFEGENHGFP